MAHMTLELTNDEVAALNAAIGDKVDSIILNDEAEPDDLRILKALRKVYATLNGHDYVSANEEDEGEGDEEDDEEC